MPSSTKKEYSVKDLRNQYKTLREAKESLNVKARGWAALVEKLNAPSYEQLEEQVERLLCENELLHKENESLRELVTKPKDFDEVGFWLLDNNFDRSRFSDFNVPAEATKIESAAKAFYKDLARKYHPDKGGIEMQMSNLSRLYDQLMALVEMNSGLGQ